jgi:lytic cellulose monooxygenase (C1-hydroxylating)
MATARAGSNVDFFWTKWLPSHQGPMITYLAPYTGPISSVNVNNLNFFKIHEAGEYPDGTFATDKMIKQNGAWNITLPHDIKAGTYVMRHELTALHFATEHSNYATIPGGTVAPQFYVSCYNVNITGGGDATPSNTVKFPGAYNGKEPGLHFDLFVNNRNYPIPGPPVYKSSGPAPKITPNPIKVISITGDPTEDKQYLAKQATLLKQQAQMTDYFQSIGG